MPRAGVVRATLTGIPRHDRDDVEVAPRVMKRAPHGRLRRLVPAPDGG
ncbi:hypothetical protein SCE1572_26435 [Sorangium cellulosum So0157-2]|uniref:Uncharacterized protein n=1 Tax=Sorangium cellulosum So0157-2 TaxID=1254432 RepID=S4XYZ9_SORCE|nr:hypothetical protein SCE1572_26435 [Sorangium cellulosum So0157-2]